MTLEFSVGVYLQGGKVAFLEKQVLYVYFSRI